MKLPHTADVPRALCEAARVRPLMKEEKVGRWSLIHFSVTPGQYRQNLAHIKMTSEHPESQQDRAVPPGHYVTLRREMTPGERRDAVEETIGMSLNNAAHEQSKLLDQRVSENDILESICPAERAVIPIMSDTRAEILEHDDALLHARGRVLITGLGLGCLPHALLKQAGVERIDIIEIDPDVIKLTGKYLTDPRVHIHQGDARDPLTFFPEGTRFDYCWHDIWSRISSDNLSDETAEHGISFDHLTEKYARLFDVGRQGCWSKNLAEMMRAVEEEAEKEELEFEGRVRAAPLDEQVELLVQRIVRSKLKVGTHQFEGIVPEEMVRMFDPDGTLRPHLRAQLQDPEFWEGWHAKRDAPPAPGERPNAHLEETQ